jgi:hypothetical protein
MHEDNQLLQIMGHLFKSIYLILPNINRSLCSTPPQFSTYKTIDYHWFIISVGLLVGKNIR